MGLKCHKLWGVARDAGRDPQGELVGLPPAPQPAARYTARALKGFVTKVE